MKFYSLLLLLWMSILAFAQTGNSCIVYIEGIAKNNNSTISKQELLALSTLEMQEPRLNKKFKPSVFEWVVSSKGQIWKGNITNLSKLNEISTKLKTGDILFVEKIKFEGFIGICEGQFVFAIE